MKLQLFRELLVLNEEFDDLIAGLVLMVGIHHSCCGACGVGGARPAAVVHPRSIHLHEQTTERRHAAASIRCSCNPQGWLRSRPG